MRTEVQLSDSDLRRRELDLICQSQIFARAAKLRQLVRWLGERAVEGVNEKPSEYLVGVDALGKPADFDPSYDVSVRQLKRRMCSRLAEYYQREGRESRFRLVCERGFAVQFEPQPLRIAERPRIAVMPLSGDDSGVVTGSLSHALAENGQVQVIGRLFIAAANPRQVVETYRLHFLIEGEIHRLPSDCWTLSLRVIDASLGYVRSAIRAEGSGIIAQPQLRDTAERLAVLLHSPAAPEAAG